MKMRGCGLSYNNKIQQANLSPALATGELKTSGKAYSIHILDVNWTEAVHDLHTKVRSCLKADEKTYLAPRNKEFFHDHLQNGGTILGVMCEGKLIAKSFIREPREGDPHSTTKVQANTVDPEYQNNGLTQHLVKTWISLSLLRGHEDAVAEVDIGNTASIVTLMKGGLSVVDMTIDPEDGGTNYVLKSPVRTAALKSIFNKAARHDTEHAVLLSEPEKITQRLKEGYKGVHIENKHMILIPK